MECTAEVQRDDQVPLVERKFLDRRNMLHARVVDQDVDAAEGLRRLRHHRLYLINPAEVMPQVEGPRPADRLETQALFLYRVAVAETVDDDIRALPGQRPRIGETNARGGASDQRGLPGQRCALGQVIFSIL